MAEFDCTKWIFEATFAALTAGAVGLYYNRRSHGRKRPVHRYEIRVGDLQPGDILLYRNGRKSIVSSLIRRFTRSPYSHAAVYLGDGKIFEAVISGIKINRLEIPRGGYIGVIRSQMGFGQERQKILQDFVSQLVKNRAQYDLRGVFQFVGVHNQDFQKNINAILAGAADIRGDARTRYFCSALVARTWCVVGIADESAWSLFLNNQISPGDISGDVNFGWFFGYLISSGTIVPDDDPMAAGTIWKEVMAALPSDSI